VFCEKHCGEIYVKVTEIDFIHQITEKKISVNLQLFSLYQFPESFDKFELYLSTVSQEILLNLLFFDVVIQKSNTFIVYTKQ